MDWETADGDGPYANIYGMDPSADWLLGAGSIHFTRADDQTLVPFIYAALDEAALSLFDQETRDLLIGEQINVLLPQLYRDKGIEIGDYVVVFAEKAFFEFLRETDGPLERLRSAKKQIKLGLPLKPVSLPPSGKEPLELTPPPSPASKLPANTVVMGIIDDGIAFAHERFRTADGKTRVHYFWHQDGPYDEENSTVDFGREIWKENLSSTRKGIDQLLGDHKHAGLVDEDAVYREAKLVDFHQPDHKTAAFTIAHGTHALDLAAGFNPSDAPENMPIVAVQLPVATTADTSGAGLEVYVQAAIDYILDRADRLAGGGDPFPVVINFSYGLLAGPHDGTSALEVAIDKAIAGRNPQLNLVLPAGNGRLSRCHAEVAPQPRKALTLDWRVLPDDKTLTHMEIWMPHGGSTAPESDRATIRVETPWGLLSGPLGETHGAMLLLLDDNNVLLARARYDFVPFPTERGVFSISMLPTALADPPGPVAPSGVWKVHVTNVKLPAESAAQAWIQRDDGIYGYPLRGRQSYFEARCYTRFDSVTGDNVIWDHEDDPKVGTCHVKRRRLLNGIATGELTTVVGGIFGSTLGIVEYSAGGPITPTRGGPVNRVGPDTMAISDDSRAHRGVIAAGSRSGAAVAMNGTSVAAPQIARKAAQLMMGPTHDGNRTAIRQTAAAEEAAASRPPLPDEINAGKGRIVLQRPDRPRRIDAT